MMGADPDITRTPSSPTSEGPAQAAEPQTQGPASISLPAIELPKGGGAIRGIGEKFAANPVTGTGSMTVPIATSPGRSGFGPELSLTYDSGSGNGPFGVGWNLSLPRITRKTDKGLPRYDDADESDVYILSGAEDLVPVFNPDGTRFTDETTKPGYIIHRYRPRVEGLFARIERWTDRATGEIRWRSISRDNVTTVYGKDDDTRIVDRADPSSADPARIFSWLICESYDDKGNAVIYEYAAEDDANIDVGKASERNRERTRNRYIKYIRYGNRVPNRDPDTWEAFPAADLPAEDWLFEVVFDYDEDHYQEVDLDATRPAAEQHRYIRAVASRVKPWAVRPDPFSSHRAGFEVRTYRRCRRVMMFHHIPDLPTGESGYDGLVRSTEFDYDDLDYSQPVTVGDEQTHQGSTRYGSFIRRVTQSGYVLDDTRAADERNDDHYATYLKRSLPPLEFEYSKAIIDDQVHELDAASLANLPAGLDGSAYQWVDLDGEGVSGILTEQAGAWHYKPNLGDGNFGPLRTVATRPSGASLRSGRQRLVDLAGDGQLDLVELSGPTPGFYERSPDHDWKQHRTFCSLPNLAWDDPNLRLVDLNGDGHADVLITEHEVFTWYPSMAEDGFGNAQRVHQPTDEELGPRLMLADGTESIYLADMSGDGLTDLVRVRNGAVCYWPNVGYGHFGAKVTMDNAPRFDNPDHFDQRRIRLADIDGSGTNDIIYLHREGARLYFNQSGNRLSDARRLQQFPPVDDVATVMTADLLGNGTACLIWSSPLPGNAGRQLRYIDLMGGTKPHLLTRSANNLGAETRIQYAPSTKFFLRDARDGRPWITRLPFPVHVVERVETRDLISRNRFVTRYAYHHGHFDGEEREFRGFGMVEQWDTEEFAALAGGDVPADNIARESHVPPAHIKTWFHTGIHVGRDHVSDYFAGLLDATDKGEYFREPGLTDAEARALLLPDTVLPAGLTPEEEREACRALKGSMLRQEVYADDAGADAAPDQIQRAHTPYAVSEQNFTIQTLQPRGGNRHGVFFTHAREAISYHYERNHADPRIQHELTLEVDAFGNVLKKAAIGYGRRTQIRVFDEHGNGQQAPNPGLTGLDATNQARQTTPLLTYTESRVTKDHDTGNDAIDRADDYRAPLPCETLAFEVTGYVASGPAIGPGTTPSESVHRYQACDFVEPDPDAPGRLRHRFSEQVPYEEAPPQGSPCRRPIEWLRMLYRRDDMSGLLPLGDVQRLALPGETYTLAFTPGLLTRVFQRPRAGQPAEPLLPDPAVVLGGQAGDRGGYVQSQTLKTDGRFPQTDVDDHWWIPTGQPFYSTTPADNATAELTQARRHFFLPRRYRNPFGQDDFVDFDAHNLLMTETRDALDNRVTVQAQDYVVLQPCLVSDPNRNQTEVVFDALGMVVSTAVMGKPEPAPTEGDSLNGVPVELTEAEIGRFLADPKGPMAARLLGNATTRIVYDLMAYWRASEAPDNPPAVVATLARETHVSDLEAGERTKIQVGLTYSDGLGRQIQSKTQAEPGPVPQRDADGKIVRGADGQPQMTSHNVNPRWIGSGWTVFNNKGKPVRSYEPFFTDAHDFEFDARIGVSSVLFYDPVQRVVAALNPNHTWEKVVFGPWRRETWDVTDTVLHGDPSADALVGSFFARLESSEYTPSWHARRQDGDLGPEAQVAAHKAEMYADTPTATHSDCLGRDIATVVHNRFRYSNAAQGDPVTEEFYETRVVFDIEGNQLEVIDAKGRLVVRYDYDMLGNRVHQASMEAGERWTLADVNGNALYGWGSRVHRFRTVYDTLRRPVASYYSDSAGDEALVGRSVFGETTPNSEIKNLRRELVALYDQAGVVLSEDFDFKGKLRRSSRQLVSQYRGTVDWSATPALEAAEYSSQTRYDALERPIQIVTPHGDYPGAEINVLQPVYNEAGLPERVDVWLSRRKLPNVLLDADSRPTSPVGISHIDYNARGQRLRIDYNNGVSTRYGYEPNTFRLMSLYTRRGASFTSDSVDPNASPVDIVATDTLPSGAYAAVQNLRYTYDPAGNITYIRDNAQQSVFFRNARIEPSVEYTYDATLRLIEANGREHLGQVGRAPVPPSYNDLGRSGLQHPNDGDAMGRYRKRYLYDAVGNFTSMEHRGTNPANSGWTLSYKYAEASQLEPTDRYSNRLTSTDVNAATATYSTGGNGYDEHGNMLRMPQLRVMQWNPWDQLQMTQRQAVNDEDEEGATRRGERTWYVYDTEGQRVRKVTTTQSGGLKDERIYLGGFEIYRRYGANAITRESLHVMYGNERIALVEKRTQGTEVGIPAQLIRYQLGNHLSSACLELDERANIVSYEEYTPFGSTSYQAVSSQTHTPKRYRYTGMERDDESGLNYHTARYYAPWIGRWINCDPALLRMFENSSESQEPHLLPLNAFEAMDNNPITVIDPGGEQPTIYTQTLERELSTPEGASRTIGVPYTPQEPLSPEEVEAVQAGRRVGEKYGQFEADLEQFSGILTRKWGGSSVWDRLPQSERDKIIDNIIAKFDELPEFTEHFGDPAVSAHAMRAFNRARERTYRKASLSNSVRTFLFGMAPFVAAGLFTGLVSALRQAGAKNIMGRLGGQASRLFGSAAKSGMVGYGGSDLSRVAISYRLDHGIKSGRNVAVYEYETAQGLQTIARASKRGVGHAERIIAKELEVMDVKPSQVTRIYSELQPCGSIPGGYCAAMIQRTFPQAVVSYSFEYGATKASRASGVDALRLAVERLFGGK